MITRTLGTERAINLARGVELLWFWLDETRDTSVTAWEMLTGRLRGYGRRADYQDFVTTSPNGFDWLWEKFVFGPSNEKELFRHIPMSTRENLSNLPAGYVGELEGVYSPEYAAQEIDAEFINRAVSWSE